MVMTAGGKIDLGEIYERDLHKYVGYDWVFENGEQFVVVNGVNRRIVPGPRVPLPEPAPYLTLEEQRMRHEMMQLQLAMKMDVPSFLLDERALYEEHAWQVRRDKKRKELAEMYGPSTPAKWLDVAADQQTLRTSTTQQIIDKLSPTIAPIPTTSPSVTGGWYAPPAAIYDGDPDLRQVNHPCKLAYEAEKPRQEERNTSMYSHESRRIAAQQLLDEKNQRDADEIIARTKAFGEDTYADNTLFRITRQFYIGISNQLEAPTTWSFLRHTDASGNTTWSDDTGRGRTWSDLVSWLVTVGKPVSPDEIETFPPAIFPTESGTVVETTISGTVQ